MFKNLFTTKNIAVMGILTAISYILYLLPKWIPIFNLPFFPAWLDIQISDLPALLGGFAISPVAAVIVVVLKCALKLPLTSTSGVGELADVLIGVAFVLPATLIYKYHKTKWFAVIGLIVGSLSATLVGVIANRFILIPFYAWFYGHGDAEKGMQIIVGSVSALYNDVTTETFYRYYLLLAVVPFNLLRCVISSVITFFIYKPLSKVLHWERNAGETGDGDLCESCDDKTENT